MEKSQQIYQVYENVPEGATLEIWVRGTAGEFVSNAVIDETNSDDDGFLTHGQLYQPAGAKTTGVWTLHSPHAYIINVRTKFNLEAEKKASVNVRIVKDGQSIGKAWEWEATGTSSSLHHLAGLFITTAPVSTTPIAAANAATNNVATV